MIRSGGGASRLRWLGHPSTGGAGWVLEVAEPFPAPLLARYAREKLAPAQKSRWLGLPLGEKKTQLREAILLLEQGQISQRVVGARGDSLGDQPVFVSNRAAHPDRTFIDLART